MINAQEALQIILDSVQPLGTITVSLENSLGRVLAEDVVSPENVPPFDNAAMDGYAIRSHDVQKSPANLALVGEISAGAVSETVLKTGEAISIMTGTKIPPGADAVVQAEWTEKLNETQVKILHSVPEYHNIRRAGADIREGSVVFKLGCR